MFRRILNEIIDFVLPPVCLCCGSPVETGDNGSSVKFICPKCYSNLERFNENHPWKEEFVSRGVIDSSFSAFWFREGNPIQTLVHEMKYGRMRSAGRLFGRELGRLVESELYDHIVPVPLHKARLRDRSYNQSEYIAEGIHGVTKAAVLPHCLVRIRYTGTQTKLNKQQRRENVKEAFAVNPKYMNEIHGKNILLVDDVITTGATILECAETLKLAGAGKVCVCSAAYAELSQS